MGTEVNGAPTNKMNTRSLAAEDAIQAIGTLLSAPVNGEQVSIGRLFNAGTIPAKEGVQAVRDFLHAPQIKCEKKGIDWFLSEEKRQLDLELCKVLAPLFLPVITAAASLMVIEDGRPPFFTQQRVGKGGVLFDMYKIRTMSDTDGTGPSMGPSDSRRTMVGGLLGRPIIDELVQLWNIWLGHMTFCASRALVEREIFRNEVPCRDGELDLTMEELLGPCGFDGWFWRGYALMPPGLVSPFGNVSVWIPKGRDYFLKRRELDCWYFGSGCLELDMMLLETKLNQSLAALQQFWIRPLGLS
ncbi:sugar transferase [Actinoallomurus purpureus]|uniref:sugar transferase n=1 Tax=Actinoallomurus purpureus TaxID=478114 RepID=UPI002093409A|nr:sugar transferase [Actinoallomurus purpureus]MCO6007590.1 sugar transferase [Actinoallomurus purpureus]